MKFTHFVPTHVFKGLQEPLQEKIILFPPLVDKLNISCELFDGKIGLYRIFNKKFDFDSKIKLIKESLKKFENGKDNSQSQQNIIANIHEQIVSVVNK